MHWEYEWKDKGEKKSLKTVEDLTNVTNCRGWVYRFRYRKEMWTTRDFRCLEDEGGDTDGETGRAGEERAVGASRGNSAGAVVASGSASSALGGACSSGSSARGTSGSSVNHGLDGRGDIADNAASTRGGSVKDRLGAGRDDSGGSVPDRLDSLSGLVDDRAD